MENKHLENQIQHQKNQYSETKYGQFFAFGISIFGIFGAVLVAYLGHETAASFLSVAALTGLAGRFINGRNVKK